MVAVGKVLARGQVTVPRDIRAALGVKPGDILSFRLVDGGKVELTRVPRMRLAEALDRYRITEPVDEGRQRQEWQIAAAADAAAVDE